MARSSSSKCGPTRWRIDLIKREIPHVVDIHPHLASPIKGEGLKGEGLKGEGLKGEGHEVLNAAP
jgi:hypothetical protein